MEWDLDVGGPQGQLELPTFVWQDAPLKQHQLNQDQIAMQSPLTANDEVSAEKPARDEGLFGRAWWPWHNIQVRGIEAECSGREAVRHQIHP